MKREQEADKLRVDLKKDERELTMITPKSVVCCIILLLIAVLIHRQEVMHGLIHQIEGAVLEGMLLPISRWVLSPFPFFFLIIFALLSNVLGKKYKIFSFSRAELGLIYMCIAFALLFPGQPIFMPLMSILFLGQYYYAIMPTQSPYAEMVGQYGSIGFLHDEDAIFSLLEGQATVPWGQWIIPIIIWTAFIVAFVYIFFLIAKIFFERWNKVERLSFGLVIPVVATANIGEGYEDKGYNYRDRLFIIGGIIPTILWIFNTLNQYYPAVPAIDLRINMYEYFPVLGFQHWPGFVVILSPLVVGLGYIIPTDISFSIWLFFLINRFFGVWIYQTGQPWWNASLYIWGAGTGAVIGFCFVIIRLGRREIVDFFKISKDGENNLNSLILGAIAMAFILFVSMYVLGLPWWITLLYLGYSFGLALIWARARAESAVPYTHTDLSNFGRRLQYLLGSDIVGWRNSIVTYGITGHIGNHLFTTSAWAMEAFKFADTVNARDKGKLTAFLTITVLVFMLALFIVLLPVLYEVGGFHNRWMMAYGNDTFGFAEGGPLDYFWLSIVVGFVGSLGLGLLRAMFYWWPISPIGFIMALDAHVAVSVFGSFFLAWIIKTFTVRYGGARVYKKLLPFFIGMIVFDIGLMGFSAIIGYFANLF